jgi:hypothetical protein
MITMMKNSCWIFFLLMLGCFTGKQEKTYFTKMNENYEDLIFVKNQYYIKDFGLSSKEFEIKKRKYRLLSDAKSSLFHVSGYIRCAGEKILLVPVEYNQDDTLIETTLFDFGAKINDSWVVVLSSESDVSIMAKVELLQLPQNVRDGTFKFKFSPFLYDSSTQEIERFSYLHCIDANLSDGIMSVATIQDNTNDTLAVFELIPRIKFKSFGWGARPL